MRAPDDTDGLTVEQRARLAYAIEIIRGAQGDLKDWSQTRPGESLYLLQHSTRTGNLKQAYHVCRAAPPL